MKTGTLDIQGALYSGEFQLIYENLISSATSSVTVSGLNGNNDIEYHIIVRQISNAGSNSSIFVRPNNDSTTNYGWQYIGAESTTTYANRDTSSGFRLSYGNNNEAGLSCMLLSATAGFPRTAIINSINAISGTTVTGVYQYGMSWNNTVDNITSLVFESSVADGIGVGTHIFIFARRKTAILSSLGMRMGGIQGLLKAGLMEKIHDFTVIGSAISSHNISGLDGNTDTLYFLEVMQIAGAANSFSYIRPNNDATSVYGLQFLSGVSSTVSAFRGGSNGFYSSYSNNGIGHSIIYSGILYAKSGYSRIFLDKGNDDINGTAVATLFTYGQVWSNTSDNITSINIVDTTNGLGVGTNIRLYALRRK